MLAAFKAGVAAFLARYDAKGDENDAALIRRLLVNQMTHPMLLDGRTRAFEADNADAVTITEKAIRMNEWCAACKCKERLIMASVRRRTWKTASGEAKAAWVVDYTDSRGNRQRKHFSNKKAADAFRIHIEGQMQTGTYRPDADKVTVKEVCESFLEHCAGRNERDERMTRKMLTVYKGHVNNHILHADHGLGSRKLSQLTARSVGDFRDQLRSAGVTVPTVRKILATLHSALEYAISQDWVATNAAHGIRVIGPRDEGSKKIVPPSKEDMRAVLDAADEDFRLMLLFAASTGARAGEQWAARWRDVDLEDGKLNISRRVDAYGEEGAPKSAAGVRTVPLSSHLPRC